MSIIDTCFRWVEAVPLKYTNSEDVAKALFSVFGRMWFPDVILSDKGSLFVSRRMRGFTDTRFIAQTFLLALPSKFKWNCGNIQLLLKANACKSDHRISH